MMQWLDLLQEVRDYGYFKRDRTGIGTYSIHGVKITVPNKGEFLPIVTTKKLAFRTMCEELAYFIDPRRPIPKVWEKNLKAKYGTIPYTEWREHFKQLLDSIRKDPEGRRHLVSVWDQKKLNEWTLPPCPFAFQILKNGDHLDMIIYQRSADLFLGLPFDIAQYAILQRLICRSTGYDSGKLSFMIGDAHIYFNHLDQVESVLKRKPYPPPQFLLADEANMFNFTPEMIKLVNYEHHGTIEAELNV